MMLWILVHFSLAGLSAGSGFANVDNSVISPPVKKSDKKFFGKDNPWDKRPAVDVLHFKHPYPVVQDSDDFDRDFVKDENSDNGEYKAQTEYDKLRHQLRKEKAQVEKAAEAKKTSEAELKDAVRRAEEAEKERTKKKEEEAAKKKAKADKKEEERKHGLISGPHDENDEDEKDRKTEYEVIPGSKTPGGVTVPGEVDVASDETKKAMDKLDECKKQLQETEKKLKKLTKELEDAKNQQEETQKTSDTLSEHSKALEDKQTAAQKAAQKEHKEYLDAKDAYLKQQALVEQMEQGIKAAADKVRVMRDSADKDGGVYPTRRSGATRSSVAPMLILIAVAVSVWVQ